MMNNLLRRFGLPLLFFILLSLSSTSGEYSESSGLTCKDHPAYRNSLNPVLVRSWYIYRTGTNPQQGAYFPRFKNATFSPARDRNSTKYKNLDYFFISGEKGNPSFRMYFQRKAKVHIIVPVARKRVDLSKSASLPGQWKSEGWIRRTAGSSTITYGIHQRQQFPISQFWYMFSQHTTTVGNDHMIDFPQNFFVKEKLKEFMVDGSFDLLIAEEDGSPSLPIGSFQGKIIEPNTKCPPALHNVWKTTDMDDPDTRGVEFRTWHPNWDPCFWCAYDHDHGSSPFHIFGYAPKYEYVARKNNNETESHNGFKGFVYRTRGLFVYYSVHALTSSIRRVTARVHTIQLVIANATTKEILVNIAHKGDYGWQSTRLSDFSNFEALTPADQALREEQDSEGSGSKFRSIPVLDTNNGTFQARTPAILGQYEDWQTLPICSRPAKASKTENTMAVIFKEPGTGIKSKVESNVLVTLGRCIPKLLPQGEECTNSNRAFVKSPAVLRALNFMNIEVSDSICPGSRNGIFYTDPTGSTTFSTPGPTHVRQYVKPGFRTVLSGRFEVVEPWVGLHGYHGRGFFHDHGYGINPLVN